MPSTAVVFLVIALAFGGSMAIAIPPFHVPDEPAHYFRAIATSHGQFFLQDSGGIRGAFLPAWSVMMAEHILGDLPGAPWKKTSWSAIRRAAPPSFAANQPTFVPVGTAGVSSRLAFTAGSYTPVPYLVPAAVHLLTSRIGASPLQAFYAGRVANLLIALGLIFLSIRIAPAGKVLFALLALTPMSIHLLASYSADSLTLAASFLFIAVSLRGILRQEPLRTSEFTQLLLSSLLVCMTKPNFLLLLPLAIPAHRFSPRQKQGAFLIVYGLAVGAGLFTASLWGADAGHYPPDISPQRQFAAVLKDPLHFGAVLFSTYFKYATRYFAEFIGKLGWFDVYLPAGAILLYYGLLSAGAWTTRVTLTLRQRFWFAALFFASALTVFVTIYCTWSTVGAGLVDGVQGRYFLPAAPLLLLALCRRENPELLPDRPDRPWLLIGSAALLSVALWKVLERYYAW